MSSALKPIHWICGTYRLGFPPIAKLSYPPQIPLFSQIPHRNILDLNLQRTISPILLPIEFMARTYEEALNCLSSLITRRTRADGANKGDNFDLMFDYVKILELDESIADLKVIHVAGTKGKGSTCAFTESILRSCGFRTGLFTSPHLIDVRERFRLDG